jgi:hypothetical protein
MAKTRKVDRKQRARPLRRAATKKKRTGTTARRRREAILDKLFPALSPEESRALEEDSFAYWGPDASRDEIGALEQEWRKRFDGSFIEFMQEHANPLDALRENVVGAVVEDAAARAETLRAMIESWRKEPPLFGTQDTLSVLVEREESYRRSVPGLTRQPTSDARDYLTRVGQLLGVMEYTFDGLTELAKRYEPTQGTRVRQCDARTLATVAIQDLTKAREKKSDNDLVRRALHALGWDIGPSTGPRRGDDAHAQKARLAVAASDYRKGVKDSRPPG